MAFSAVWEICTVLDIHVGAMRSMIVSSWVKLEVSCNLYADTYDPLCAELWLIQCNEAVLLLQLPHVHSAFSPVTGGTAASEWPTIPASLQRNHRERSKLWPVCGRDPESRGTWNIYWFRDPRKVIHCISLSVTTYQSSQWPAYTVLYRAPGWDVGVSQHALGEGTHYEGTGGYSVQPPPGSDWQWRFSKGAEVCRGGKMSINHVAAA